MTDQNAEKPDDQRCAAYLFGLLGRPKEFNTAETMTYWTTQIRECMGEAEHDRKQFKKFLEWVMELNAYSAEYMRNAKDPVKTLKKNLPTLLRQYGAYLKGQEALERSKNKFKAKDQPQYRQESGTRPILKGDV